VALPTVVWKWIVVDVSAPHSLQYSDTVSHWLRDRKGTQPVKNHCHISAKVLFSNKRRKMTDGELANPGSPGNWPLKR